MSFTIRPATESDIAPLAAIHNRGWQEAGKGIVDQDYLDHLRVEDRAADWKRWLEKGDQQVLLAATDFAEPAGFISFGPLRTPPPGMSPIRPLYGSEVYALYILPSCWRQGLGRLLLRQAAERLAEQKKNSLCLWVMEKNKRANVFYKALGGQRCGKHEVQIGPSRVREVCYGWRDTAQLLA